MISEKRWIYQSEKTFEKGNRELSREQAVKKIKTHKQPAKGSREQAVKKIKTHKQPAKGSHSEIYRRTLT